VKRCALRRLDGERRDASEGKGVLLLLLISPLLSSSFKLSTLNNSAGREGSS